MVSHGPRLVGSLCHHAAGSRRAALLANHRSQRASRLKTPNKTSPSDSEPQILAPRPHPIFESRSSHSLRKDRQKQKCSSPVLPPPSAPRRASSCVIPPCLPADRTGALQLDPGRRWCSQEGALQCVSAIAKDLADNADWGMIFSVAGVAGLAAYAYINRTEGELRGLRCCS